MSKGRFLRIASIALLAAIACLSGHAAVARRIVPLQVSATFSAQSPNSLLSHPVTSPDGRVLYILSLEPEIDVHNRIVCVDVDLHRPGVRDTNLLEPEGRWHGIQPYTLVADDLVRGPDRSIYGDSRLIVARKLGLALRITVVEAEISSEMPHQIERLTLQMTLDDIAP